MDTAIAALAVFIVICAALTLIGVVEWIGNKFKPKRRPMATPIRDERSSIETFRGIIGR